MDDENATTSTTNTIARTNDVALFMLNPNAEAWDPEIARGEAEDRTLFVTFSNGHPLKNYQIRNFFNRLYGDSVEDVQITWPKPPSSPPLFGHVTFMRRSIPMIILRDREEVEFRVDGKALRCKKYRPRDRNN